MKSVIVGAGEVGCSISTNLRQRGHNVIVIDESGEAARQLDDAQDVKVLVGNGASARMLDEAGIEDARNFLALTSDDRTNLVACKVARQLGKRLFTVARVHDRTYLERDRVAYQELFDVDFLLNPEMLSAVELAKEIRHPGRVAIEHFARGQIEVQNMAVDPSSRLIGVTLRDLSLDSGMRVGLITRDGETSVARADTEFRAGDQLTVFGSSEVLSEFRSQAEPGDRPHKVRVVLYGGTEVAITLVRLLSNPRFRIRIIDPDENVCAAVAEQCPNVTVIHGDAGSRRLLEEEQIGAADYFVACTKDDEHNIMTSLQAAKLDAGNVQLVINKSDYENLLDDLRATMGVSRIVSPRRAAVNEVTRYLDRTELVILPSMSVRGTSLAEVAVGRNSSVLGRKLADLELPEGCLLVALVRGPDARVPGASDTVEDADRILVAVDEEHREEVARLFTGKG